MAEDTPDTDGGDVSTNEENDGSSDGKSLRETWGSIIGAMLVIGFGALIVLAALGSAALSSIPQMWFALLSILVLMAATQVFGKDVLAAVEEFRDK